MTDQTTPGPWGDPVPAQDGPVETRPRRPLNPTDGGGRTAALTREAGPTHRSGPVANRTVYPRSGHESAIRVGRKERRRVRIVERFYGQRVRSHVSLWRRVRSIVYLVIIGALLVAATAAVLAAIVAGIAVGFHHLSKGG